MKKKSTLVLGLIMMMINTFGQWQLSNGTSGINGKVILAIGTDIYLGTGSDGVYKSTDNGENWNEYNSDLNSETDYSITKLSKMGNSLIATTYDNGVFINYNDSDSWLSITGSLPASTINPITACYSNDTLIVIGVENYGVYYTTDTGTVWTLANTNLTSTFLRELYINDTKVYACSQDGLFVANISDFEWANLNSNSSQTVNIIDNKIYLGTRDMGIYYSIDNGSNWLSMNNTAIESSKITSIISDDNNIYVSANASVYQTSKNTSNWIITGNGLSTKYSNDLIYVDNRLISATGYDGASYYSLGTEIENLSELNELIIYPNPATEVIYLNESFTGSNFTIKSINGQVKLSGKITNSMLNISQLIPGIYIMKISNKEYSSTYKIIKK